MIKIGVLGTGDVGRVLGAGFAKLGHPVMIGSRDPKSEKVQAWVKKTGAASGTFAEASSFGEAVVLATLGTAVPDVVKLAGERAFDGKVLIDATNPLSFAGGKPALTVGFTDSMGESVQRLLPKARVVKAFNSVGNALMVSPDLPGGPPDMFICGNDSSAKATVTALCRELGWGVVDIGAIDGARYLEPLAMVWIRHGFATNSWTHAFKLLRRPL